MTSRVVVAMIAAQVCVLTAIGADANVPASRPGDTSASAVGAKITRLLQNKPEVPITLPKNMAKPASVLPLPAEGTMVVDRLCKMWSERKSPWLVVTFEREPDRKDEIERRVLPSELMERMETLAARYPGTQFRVSGETTVFEGKAYLLLSKVTHLPDEAQAAKPKNAPTLLTAKDLQVRTPPTAKSANVDANAPTTAPAAGSADREPSSSDLLNEMLGEKIGKPIQTIPVLPDAPKPPSVAPVASASLPVMRQEIVADRLVRVMRDPKGRWWQAVFEADNTLQEPPMALLPCGNLAKAIDMAGKARPGRTRVFRVSGKVTKYEGKRYLLLRKVLLELNLGQF